MTFLLDTNAFLWTIAAADKLGARTAADLANQRHNVYVPDIVLLEAAVKARTYKLDLTFDFSAIDSFLSSANIQQLGFDAWSALQYVDLPQLGWSDPFDLAIMSQAIAKRMTLVTSDRNILAANLPGLHTLDARS